MRTHGVTSDVTEGASMFVSGTRKSDESCENFSPEFLVGIINDKLKVFKAKCLGNAYLKRWSYFGKSSKKSVDIILVLYDSIRQSLVLLYGL